jgi:hypothetical protein
MEATGLPLKAMSQSPGVTPPLAAGPCGSTSATSTYVLASSFSFRCHMAKTWRLYDQRWGYSNL